MHGAAGQGVGEGDFGGMEHEALAGQAGAVEGVAYNREVESVDVAGMEAQLVGAAGLGHKKDSCGFFTAAVRCPVGHKAKIFPVCDAKLAEFFVVNLVGAVIGVKADF